MAPPRRRPGPPYVGINGSRGWVILDAPCAQPEDPDVLNSLIYAKSPLPPRVGDPTASQRAASRCADCRGGTVSAPRKRRTCDSDCRSRTTGVAGAWLRVLRGN